MPSPDCVIGGLENVDPTMTVTATLSGIDLDPTPASIIPAIQATWTTAAVASSYITDLQFQYVNDSGGGYTEGSAKADRLAWTSSNQMVSGQTYSIRYRAAGAGVVGPWSPWVSIMVPSQAGGGTTALVDWSNLTGTIPSVVLNANVGVGVNCLVNSDFTRGATYWVPDSGNTGLPVSEGVDLAGSPPYYAPSIHQLYVFVNTTTAPAAGTYFGVAPDGNLSELPCAAGDRLYLRALVAYHRCSAYLNIAWYDINNNLLALVGLQGGPASGSGAAGDYGGANASNLYELAANVNVPPDGTYSQPVRRAKLHISGNVTGAASPYLFIREPMMCRVNPGQTAKTPYSPGRTDPLADQTGVNQAATFANQGDLSTKSSLTLGATGSAGQLLLQGFGALAGKGQADWAADVTGTHKPQDDATKSYVYRSTTAPTGASLNDIWVKIDGSGVGIAAYAWNGSAWILGADPTGANQAATIANQGTGATASTLFGLNNRDYLSLFTPKSSNLVTDSTGEHGGRGWTFAGGAGAYVLNGYDWVAAYVAYASPSSAVSGQFNVGATLQYTFQAEMNVGSATGGSFDMSCDVEFLKSDGSNAGYSTRLQIGWNGSAFVIQSGNDAGNPDGLHPWPGGGAWASLWIQGTAPTGSATARVRCYTENQTGGTVYFRKLQFRGTWGGPFPWTEDNTPFARAGTVTGAAVDANMDTTARIISANGVPLQASANYGITFDTNPPVTSSSSSSVSFPANTIRLMGGVSYSTASTVLSGLGAGTNYLCSYNVIDLVQGVNLAASPIFLNDPSKFIIEGTQYTQSSGGSYPTPPTNPGGGGKNGCPAPDMPLLFANEDRTGPGRTGTADEARPGLWVWTAHEDTLEWGAYEIKDVEYIGDAERACMTLADGREWIGSPGHRWFTRLGGYVAMRDLAPGEQLIGGVVESVRPCEAGPVVKIAVRDARTYVSMALCHNVKQFVT